ncbi:MAG: CBS domain-containing protein [Nitrospirota bacterium]
MELKDLMTRDIETVGPDDALQTAARKMRARDVGFLPVCEGDHVMGVLTDRDITIRATAEGLDPKTAAAREVMTTAVVCCYEDESIDEAAQLMKENQIRRLMVLNRDNKRLVGIIALGDLATGIGDDRLSGEVLHSVSASVGMPLDARWSP